MKHSLLDIHAIYKFAKFQYDWAIFDFSRLPQKL